MNLFLRRPGESRHGADRGGSAATAQGKGETQWVSCR